MHFLPFSLSLVKRYTAVPSLDLVTLEMLFYRPLWSRLPLVVALQKQEKIQPGSTVSVMRRRARLAGGPETGRQGHLVPGVSNKVEKQGKTTSLAPQGYTGRKVMSIVYMTYPVLSNIKEWSRKLSENIKTYVWKWERKKKWNIKRKFSISNEMYSGGKDLRRRFINLVRDDLLMRSGAQEMLLLSFWWRDVLWQWPSPAGGPHLLQKLVCPSHLYWHQATNDTRYPQQGLVDMARCSRSVDHHWKNWWEFSTSWYSYGNRKTTFACPSTEQTQLLASKGL